MQGVGLTRGRRPHVHQSAHLKAEKPWSCHSDDLKRVATEPNRPPEDCRVEVKATLPKPVANYGDRNLAITVRGEHAADGRLNTQGFEVISRNCMMADP